MISINEVDDGSNRSCQIFTSIRWIGGFFLGHGHGSFHVKKLSLHKHGQ